MLAFFTVLVQVHFELATVYDPVRIPHFRPQNQIHLSKKQRYEVVLARNPITSAFLRLLTGGAFAAATPGAPVPISKKGCVNLPMIFLRFKYVLAPLSSIRAKAKPFHTSHWPFLE